MSKLSIRLLGEFSVSISGIAVERFATDKVRALLAYLAAESDKAHTRTQLATLLWGDWDDTGAKANLRKTLFRLKKGLGALADELLTISRSSVEFHAESAEIDLHQFTQLSQQDDIDSLTTATTLYHGNLLASFDIEDAPEFNEWLTVQRENLHQQYLVLLYRLGELHLAQENYTAAQSLAQEQLALESWREGAHRQMMRVFEAQGQRAEALAQYDRCCDILEAELGVAPSAETQELAAAIRGEQLLNTHLHNFTDTINQFVGREADINRLIARLNVPTTRLITLFGTGGVGKTRLVTEALRRSLGNRAAYFLPLHNVTTQDGIWQLLGEQLDIKAERSLRDGVLAFLRKRAPLLVFDNYEQLLPDTRCIEEILRRTDDVQIVVTSRAPLNLRAEWRLPLTGLSFPTDTGNNSDDYPAMQLLLKLGQQVAPELELSAENRPHIARICRHLAGMPLALEMAGSWLGLYPPDMLADTLEHNLDLLVATRQDVPERQRSLRVIFDYTMGQLGSAETTLLQKLTVFQGTFSLRAILMILAASPLQLNALVDHALLQRQRDHFQLHPVLRQFLTTPLPQALHEKHALYYLQHIAALKATAIAETADDISRNRANVRAAWLWAVEQRDVQLLEGAFGGLQIYYKFRGYFGEGRDLFKLAADALDDSVFVDRLRLAEAFALKNLGEFEAATAIIERVKQTERAETQLEALTQLALLYERRMRHDEALVIAQEGLTLAQPISTEAAALWTTINEIYRYRGAPIVTRMEAAQQLLTIGKQLEDVLLSAEAHNMLAMIYRDTGDYDAAIEHIEQAVATVRQLNHQTQLAKFLNSLGSIRTKQYNLDEAERAYQEALSLTQSLGHKQGVTICTGNLGSIAKMRRDYPVALRYYDRALQMATETGDNASIAVFLGNRGNALMDMGRYDEALVSLERAAETDRAAGALKGVGRNLGNAGDTLRFQQRFAEAVPYYDEALTHLRQSETPFYLCWVLVAYGACLFELGRFEEAERLVNEGVAMADEIGRPYYSGFGRIIQARLAARTGDVAEQVAYLTSLAAQEDEDEVRAEISAAIWHMMKDDAARIDAVQRFDAMYQVSKRERYAAWRDMLQPHTAI